MRRPRVDGQPTFRSEVFTTLHAVCLGSGNQGALRPIPLYSQRRGYLWGSTPYEFISVFCYRWFSGCRLVMPNPCGPCLRVRCWGCHHFRHCCFRSIGSGVSSRLGFPVTCRDLDMRCVAFHHAQASRGAPTGDTTEPRPPACSHRRRLPQSSHPPLQGTTASLKETEGLRDTD